MDDDDRIGEILVPPEDLARRVEELAAEISRDYAGRDLVLIGVLKGAVFFLSDLMRSLEVPVELDFMAVASYGSATKSSGVVRILKDLDAVIEDRDVLIVEDIVDSGLTLQYLLRTPGGPKPALARGMRASDQARATQGGPAHAVRRLRNPESFRDWVWARPPRALPQSALRCRAEAVSPNVATAWPKLPARRVIRPRGSAPSSLSRRQTRLLRLPIADSEPARRRRDLPL